jgi:hypothetical protein
MNGRARSLACNEREGTVFSRADLYVTHGSATKERFSKVKRELLDDE